MKWVSVLDRHPGLQLLWYSLQAASALKILIFSSFKWGPASTVDAIAKAECERGDKDYQVRNQQWVTGYMEVLVSVSAPGVATSPHTGVGSRVAPKLQHFKWLRTKPALVVVHQLPVPKGSYCRLPCMPLPDWRHAESPQNSRPRHFTATETIKEDKGVGWRGRVCM